MNKKEFFDLIDLNIRIKYKTKVEFANVLGITRATLSNNLKKLENGDNITLDVLMKMLDALGLELIIQEKK